MGYLHVTVGFNAMQFVLFCSMEWILVSMRKWLQRFMDWIFGKVEYRGEVYPYIGYVLWEAQEIQYERRQSLAPVLRSR
ncbi:transmembrane protein, putative [Medicago truncatula]|nr:transmembrane protein, putative [Medicago truncatula]